MAKAGNEQQSKKRGTPGATAAGGETQEKTPAQQMRELFTCLAVAVAMALLIKYVLVEVFVIPSGSMEPTLNGRPDGGDRVLCTKINYRWRDPRRWEIFVFKYPYDEAQQYTQGRDAEFRGQNFIKRCVGLPGDLRLAIARGDIFTLRNDGTWRREVKPLPVQESIWIPVYHEDFSDLAPEEFLEFWWQSGAKTSLRISPGGTLHFQSARSSQLHYRPRLPTGFPDQPPRLLAGIPDRYVVRQPVTFTCPYCNRRPQTIMPAGAASDGPRQVRRTVWDQKIAARCPYCGRYLLENSVVFYGRRSDLPIAGRHAYAGETAKQGEAGKYRGVDYHFVPDLRVRVRVRPGPGVVFSIEIQDEQRLLRAELSNTRAQLLLNGRELDTVARGLAPATWHEVELHFADNVLRLLVDDLRTPLLVRDFNRRGQPKPGPRVTVAKSGVMLGVSHGAVDIDRIRIGRDIYYYSGRENVASRESPFKLIDVEGAFTRRGFIAMGDNSPSSNDSRCWGPVPPDNLRGPALLVWWPLHRIHLLTLP